MKCCSGANCSGCAAMNILILQIPVLYFTSSLSATICSVVAFLVWTLQLGTLSVHASQQVLNPIFPQNYYVSRAGCEDCCHSGLNYISKGVKYIFTCTQWGQDLFSPCFSSEVYNPEPAFDNNKQGQQTRKHTWFRPFINRRKWGANEFNQPCMHTTDPKGTTILFWYNPS